MQNLGIYFPVYAQSNKEGEPLIKLLTPTEGTQIIAKKPLIKCSIKPPFDPQKLLVILDGTDVSGILDITPDGFEYKPIGVLASGSHTLSVTVYTTDGKELKKEFTFSSRHSKPFEEAFIKNEITTLNEKLLGKSEEVSNVNSWKFESNLSNESKLKEKDVEFIFKTNIRYLDQHLRVTPPIEDGFILQNYLLQGKYTSKIFTFLSEIGDLQITETPNTVQGLARRGGNLVFQSKDLNLQFRTFAVKSEQIIGFREGLGIGTTPADHIVGASGDLGLFSDKLKFRTIYVKGGQEGSSLGISTTGGSKQGDVLGFFSTTDFFKQKLVTEAELDFARFDADTSDEFPRIRDKAYRLKAGGILGKFNYEALYEYTGCDYEVIGSPGVQKNREGYTLKAGANFPIHLINLSFSRYHDNVKKEDIFPTIYNNQGSIDYTFSKFKSLPIGLSYQKSAIRSEMEPQGISSTKTETDTITGKINYTKGQLNLGFQTSYSFQDDKTDQNNDTSTVTYTFTPTYTFEKPSLSISPNFSFNRSKNHLTGIHTDTHTATLDLRGDLINKKLTYGFGGTYTISKPSDGSSNQDSFSSNFNVSYLLIKNYLGFFNPSVGVRGTYNRTNNRIVDHTTDEFVIFLVIQTTMSFSF